MGSKLTEIWTKDCVGVFFETQCISRIKPKKARDLIIMTDYTVNIAKSMISHVMSSMAASYIT